jgi:hypothetical protein
MGHELYARCRVTFELQHDHGAGPSYVMTIWTRTQWHDDVMWDLSTQTGRKITELRIRIIELIDSKPGLPARPLSYREHAERDQEPIGQGDGYSPYM